MARHRRRKCLHCGQLFTPDCRNRRHQRYCAEAACRKASKAASQRRWQQRPDNRDYFRDPLHGQRVRAWRDEHPYYWRRRAALDTDALQDLSMPQPIESTEEITPLLKPALQDLIDTQAYVLIGLIANLTGTTLQDDIACCGRKFQQLGRDILNPGGGDEQAPDMPRTSTPPTRTVQLGRSATGPP